MSFDMEECRADKNWAHFYKIGVIKKCLEKKLFSYSNMLKKITKFQKNQGDFRHLEN